MTTIKLYYEDPYRKEFDAQILSCEPGKGGFQLILDRTAFYPEGGGQPADRGWLGGFRVTDVHEKEGSIVHTLEYADAGAGEADGAENSKIPEELQPGRQIHGKLDWERRFDHMQQHSGEHIVSGMICSRFACNNVGFHMGADFVTIDYDKPVTREELQQIEAEANCYISEGHDFVELWPTAEELKTLSYRSKKELSGAVRIASFPGADCCACCGTHVKNSAEVGFVKLFSVHAFREGVRIEMMSGNRAFRYLSACYEQNILCSQASSAKPLETGTAVQGMKEEIISLKGRIIGLENKVFESMADALAGADSPVLFLDAMGPDALRKLTVRLGQAAKGRILVLAENGAGYSYAMLEAGGDLKAFVTEFNAALQGRGGGRDGYAQGSVQAGRAEIEAFLKNKGFHI